MIAMGGVKRYLNKVSGKLDRTNLSLNKWAKRYLNEVGRKLN